MFIPPTAILLGIIALVQLCMLAMWAGASRQPPALRMLAVAMAGLMLSGLPFGSGFIVFLFPTIATFALLKLAGFHLVRKGQPLPVIDRHWQFSIRGVLGWMAGLAIMAAGIHYSQSGHGPFLSEDDPGTWLFAITLAMICAASAWVALGEHRTLTPLLFGLGSLVALPVMMQVLRDWSGSRFLNPHRGSEAPPVVYLSYLLMIAAGLGELCVVRWCGFRWFRIRAMPTEKKEADHTGSASLDR